MRCSARKLRFMPLLLYHYNICVPAKYGFPDFSCHAPCIGFFIVFFLSFSTFCPKHPGWRRCSGCAGFSHRREPLLLGRCHGRWPGQGSTLRPFPSGTADASPIPARLTRCGSAGRSVHTGVKPAGSTNSCAETIKPAPRGF